LTLKLIDKAVAVDAHVGNEKDSNGMDPVPDQAFACG
jgi:hypothetical protein